jgi:hypothetical protein
MNYAGNNSLVSTKVAMDVVEILDCGATRGFPSRNPPHGFV